MSVSERVIKAIGQVGIEVKTDVPLSEMTSLGIGGLADLLILPKTPEEISSALSILADDGTPVFPIGFGTNLLVSDAGFKGALIRPTSSRCDGRGDGRYIVGAALPLDDMVVRAADDGRVGSEELAGIPGSVGGAVAMNAGAWETATSDIVADVVAFDLSGAETEFDLSGAFDYRAFTGRGGMAIAEAELLFKDVGEPMTLKSKIAEIRMRRAQTQPIGERSAGCIFKNPLGGFAGRLIEKAGLKGTAVGGAMVSEIHANFIINRGGATAEDIITLITKIRETIHDIFGIELELEIITLGFDK